MAVEQYVRYEVPNENNETRREINERFGASHLTPDFHIPEDGFYLWQTFWRISDGVNRNGDGICLAIPWTELEAFQRLAENPLTLDEITIIKAVDVVFCDAMNRERAAARERANARSKDK